MEAQNATFETVLADAQWIFNMCIAYFVFGSFLIAANTPIFVSILRHSILRAKKEYLLLAGLAFADLLEGWATLIAGFFRMWLVSKGRGYEQIAPWDCIHSPHFLIMSFANVVQAGMLLIISIDRLVAMLKPLQYHTFTTKYAIGLVGLCYSLGIVHVGCLLLYIQSYDEAGTPEVHIPAVCFTTDVDKNTTVYARFGLGIMGVVIYGAVCCLYGNYQRTMVANFPTLETRLRRTQLRLTVTVGICALLTVVCYLLPTSLLLTDFASSYFATLYWVMNCSNAVVNVFVYSLRHADIRSGLKLLFQCEQMPTDAVKRLRSESSPINSVTAKAALIFTRHGFNGHVKNGSDTKLFEKSDFCHFSSA